jgi:hypothetical protein
VNAALESQLAFVMLTQDQFTADDVTMSGVLVLDAAHQPNGKQSGIGSLFSRAAREKRIEWTGEVVRSAAPHRKNGAIRVWRPTTVGRDWARSLR